MNRKFELGKALARLGIQTQPAQTECHPSTTRATAIYEY